MNALFNLLLSSVDLGGGEVVVAGVDRLELAALDRDQSLAKELQVSAQGNEPPTHVADSSSVVTSEVDAFVGELDLTKLGFEGAEPAATGRPSYHPADLLKVYIYDYVNPVQSSRRLERECQRNLELMWLTGRLASDFKTIAR